MIRSEELPASLAALLKGRMNDADLWRVLRTSLLSVGRLKGLIEAVGMAPGTGDTAEIGTAHGGTSYLMAKLNGGRTHWACDTFAGLVDVCEHDTLSNGQFHNTAEKVKDVIGALPNVRMVKGYFPKSASVAMKRAKFSVVHIDVDTYTSIKACFEFFVQRMTPGGIIVLDDVLERGCVGAIKAFEELKQQGGNWSVIRTDAPPQAVVRVN